MYVRRIISRDLPAAERAGRFFEKRNKDLPSDCQIRAKTRVGLTREGYKIAALFHARTNERCWTVRRSYFYRSCLDPANLGKRLFLPSIRFSETRKKFVLRRVFLAIGLHIDMYGRANFMAQVENSAMRCLR